MPGLAPSVEPLPALPDFETVYDQCFEFVWRSLRRLGVPDGLVDDATHDVFVIVYRKLPSFEGRSSIRTWLFAIALRVASFHRTREARQSLAGDAPSDPPDSERRLPDAEVARREAQLMVQRVLDQLDDDRRAVLVAVEIEQISVPELAEATGIPLNTAYSRLRLARRDFEQALRRIEAKECWRVRWNS